jgi:hypothetical protein
MNGTWKTLAVAVSAFAVFGLGWATAQTKTPASRLTAQDDFEIRQLYAGYTHAYDHGDKDGRDYAATFVPDGMLVVVTPAVSPCTHGDMWEAGDRDIIRGSIADVKNINVCIEKMIGTEKLAALATWFKDRNGFTERHVNTNLLLTPTADGAKGTMYLNQLTIKPKPPTWSTSGVYNDTLVRTPNGWRFKQRIITQDSVLAGRPN